VVGFADRAFNILVNGYTPLFIDCLNARTAEPSTLQRH